MRQPDSTQTPSVGSDEAVDTVSLTSSAEADSIVEELARNQIETYRRQSREFASHYNRERSAVDGYRGRQLLELLQNADDAGAGNGEAKLLIELDSDRLVVANKGTPFSRRGLESLVISDSSPKQFDRNRFIGCKGLGFRSILTWTERPLLSSSPLRVAFDREKARTRIKELISADPGLRKVVKELSTTDVYFPVPIMRFPFVPPADHPDLLVAAQYHEKGYETVLVLPLGSEQGIDWVRDNIVSQMTALTTEMLLFCRNLSEVDLRGPTGWRCRWQILRQRLTPDKSTVCVDDGAGGNQLWTIHTRQGRVPGDLAAAGVAAKQEYETAVAVPEKPVSNDKHALCVFFPTQDRLPLPVVLHATLELTDNRNRLLDTAKNRHVLSALAHHLADVIDAEAVPESPRRALDLLQGLEDADSELEDLGFVAAVIQLVRGKLVFPRLDGELDSAAGVRQAPDDAWKPLLRPEHFANVLDIWSEDKLAGVLALLDLEWYSGDELLRRLRSQVTAMDLEESGKLVASLITIDRLGSLPVASLLVDSSGLCVDADSSCYFTPTAELPAVPSWVNGIRFLAPAFQRGLQDGASIATLRNLSALLERRQARVDEYRMDAIARALGTGARNAHAADQPSRVRDLLRWLYEASAGEPPALTGVTVPVLDSQLTIRSPDRCYFGDGYQRGTFLRRLYAGIKDVVFLASPDQLGLDHFPPDAVEHFLSALGVCDAPRPSALPGSELTPFVDWVLESRDYPLAIRGELRADVTQVRAICADYSIANLLVPDSLIELLKGGDTTALIAYLLTRGSSCIAQEYDAEARLVCRLPREHWARPEPSIPIPNPVLQYLRTRPWVPGEDGKRHTPSEIILSGAGSRVLHGLFFRHVIQVDDPIIQTAGGAKAVRGLLTRLGAISSFDEMDSDALYDLLLRLPEDDPDGTYAPGIYRTLIEARVQPEDSPLKRRFHEKGEIWSKHEGLAGYRSVTDVRYNANVTVPPLIEQHLTLADLPRRQGTRVVQQLFGVAALTNADVLIEVPLDQVEYDVSSEPANTHFRMAMPFLYALRLNSTLDEAARELNLLARATLRLCIRISVLVTLPGEDVRQIELAEQGSSILVKDTLYVVGEYSPSAPTLIRFWQGVANLVAELLGINVGHEAANILRCRNQVEMEDVVHGAVGNRADELLATALTRFQRLEAPEADLLYQLPRPAQSVVGTGAPADGRIPSVATSAVEEHELDGATASHIPPTPVFQPIAGPQPGKHKKRQLVVTGSASDQRGRAGRGPLATEAVTFTVVEAYEEIAVPKRFPIRVDHVRGTDGFGCDILSLRSEEARTKAREERVIEDVDIVRFIEVKGRSARTGEVELVDNEYSQAQRTPDRYFVYRVFCDPNASTHFEVAILKDPIHSHAFRLVTRFDLAEGSGAEWFAMENKFVSDDDGALDTANRVR